MGRKKNLPKVTVDYNELDPSLKAVYDKLVDMLERKTLSEVKMEANAVGVESPTMLDKHELIRRAVDKMVYPFIPPKYKPNPGLWNYFKDKEGNRRVKGYCQFRNGQWVVGRVVILPLLLKLHDIREGDRIEGIVSVVNGVAMLITITYLENDGIERDYFSELRLVEKRPCDIGDTKAGDMLKGLQVGERVIMKNMTLDYAAELANSFYRSVRLYVGFPPEIEPSYDQEIFVAEFSLSKAEVAEIVKLSVERCKRIAELGNDVVLIVAGYDALCDEDLERCVIGAGRCFRKGGLTVIVDSKDPNKDKFFGQIATRTI